MYYDHLWIIMMVVGVAFFSGSAIHVIDRLDRPQQRRRTV